MCPAALSSLHVRARTGCASAASSASALACTQQLVAVPEERKGNPAQGDPTHPYQAPAGTMCGGFKLWFTIQDVLQQGKYFSISVWAGFSPGKVQGSCWTVWEHLSMCKGQNQDSAAITGVLGKSTTPKHTWHSGGSATSLLRGVYPKKNSVFEAWPDPTNQPPGQCVSPLWSPHWQPLDCCGYTM